MKYHCSDGVHALKPIKRMKNKLLLLVCLLLTGSNLMAQSTYQWKTVTANGYTYKYVTNDPSETRFYT